MKLSQKETSFLKDLQSQEKLCVEKYNFYGEQAKDPALKSLFGKIKEDEQRHYDSLGEVMNGQVPAVKAKKEKGAQYEPSATYPQNGKSADKRNDKFLCTDSIATEKYVSSEYGSDLFHFGSTDVRRLLNDIQTEEQNHAEMIYKYKTANGMC